MQKPRFFSLIMVLTLCLMLSFSPILASTTRPIIVGTFGMVTSNHPLASKVGMDILDQGGNAVDAAVAALAAIGVVEPYLSGAGGDGFAFYYDAADDQLHYLNYSGRSPQALTLEHFKTDDGYSIPGRGPMVTMIPGAFMGWNELANRFGTFSFADLLQPAIKLAEEGYPLTQMGERNFNAQLSRAVDWGAYGLDAWYGGEIEAPKIGEIVKNPNLAETYRRVANEGIEVFYGGEIGQHMVDFIRSEGGVWTIEDLENFYVEWDKPAPIEFSYRDYDFYTVPYNSSGGVATAQILNMMEAYDVVGMGVNSAGFLHLLIEAVKLAAADRAEWACDPDLLDVPFDLLVSKEYAAERRALINPYKAAEGYNAGVEQPGTSTLSVVDKDGNMVTAVFTLGSGWGSGVTAGDTGITLNNAVVWLEADPNSPAVVQGGVRTRWNMHMVLGVHQETKERFVMSTPGGTSIWQTMPQVISKMLDFGMNMQEAIESPRFRWSLSGTLTRMEDRIPEDVIRHLEAFGHEIQLYTSYSASVGGVAGVTYNPETGVMTGAADPRRDGYAIGF